jgi:hypothetical protein
MSRYARFALTLLAIVITIVGALGGARIAGAAPPPSSRPAAARTPLQPLRASPSPSPTPAAYAAPNGPIYHNWHKGPKSLPRPPYWPKLEDFLVKTGPHTLGVRKARPITTMMAGRARPFAANGSTVILTGDQSNYFTNDITLAYGADVYLSCQNMPTNGSYTFVVYPPDGSGPITASAINASTGNNDCNGYENFNLSTPFANNAGTTVASDPAYPGVWIVALYNGTTYITEVAIIADATINFSTYANLGLTTPTNDFVPGSQIVVGASGLNPAHNYSIGWVFTGGNNLPCEFSVPAGSANSTNNVCFTGTPAGLQAYGGNLTQYWGPSSSPSTSAAPTGTYDVELYDDSEVNGAKTGAMVSHQQISIEPSTVSWTLTPYNASGATPPPGFSYNSTFATDGLQDQSVTGLTYAASGLQGTSGNTLDLTISDPNGVVLTPESTYCNPAPPTACNYPVTQGVPTVAETGGGGSGTASKQVAFPLNATYQEALGPTQTPFAPNVLTAQLYDTNTSTILGSKSFTLLGYEASTVWSTNTILQAGAAPTTGTVVITNTGASSFGAWNGDAITGVQISSVAANGETIGLSSTTAVDSAGNAWTISSSGTGVNTVITATANQRNTGVPVGGTLQFNITVSIPSGDCTSACLLPTQVLPEHGIAFSAQDTASQALQVLNSSSNPSSVLPTETWAVLSESATANMAARVAKYDHMTYIYGTANSPSSDYYLIDVTLNNVASPGNHDLSEVEFTFPSAIDLNANNGTAAVSLQSSPAGTGTWELLTNSTKNAANAYPLGTANQNVFALACNQNAADKCGIPVGQSGTFELKFLLFDTSFTETSIAGVANFDKGNAYGNCGGCNDASYNLNPTSTTVNAIAGTTNVNSTELAAYSLNPTLMTMQFQPSTIGVVSPTTDSLVFSNTPQSHDPNPDWVDEVHLTFPAAANPSSITVPSGWFAFSPSADNWVIALCGSPGPTNANPCSTNETASAIAPGGQLSMTVNWSTAPAAGTYNVTWWVMGANGGEDTSATNSTTPITFSNTTASVAFTAINGVNVPNGTEPQVGTDSVISGTPWADKGSAYQMTVKNTGSTTLDEILIDVPYQTRSGAAGSDGKTQNPNTAGYYYVTSVSLAYSGGAGGCSPAIVQPKSTAVGTITLTGCTIPSGSSVVVTFDAQTPYLIGNEFVFTTFVYQATTQFATQPLYSSANVVSVVLNGTLTLLTPAVGWTAPTQPNSLSPIDNTLTPQTNCVSCQVFSGSPTTVDFGSGFSGNFNATDVVDASVLSDANNISSNSWVLYVTTSPGSNPSNMLYTDVDSNSGRSSSAETISQTTLTPVLATTPGLQLSTYAGLPYHGPLDSVMNYEVVTGGNTSPEAVTLTYTLVFN